LEILVQQNVFFKPGWGGFPEKRREEKIREEERR
jgi:hypothetical protein